MKRLSVAIVLGLLVSACASAPEKKPEPAVEATPPVAEPLSVPEAEQWRAAQPTPGAQPALVLPEVQEGKLRNKVRLLVHSRRDLPIVDVRLVLRAGAALDPVAKAGLADLTYEMMLEGSGKKDGVALAEAFSDLGTRLSVNTGADGASFQMLVLKRNLEPALKLLAQVIQKPRFDKKDFERRQKEALADLARALAQPFYLAQVASWQAIFGKDHPYGHVSSGTPDTVTAITLKDVKKFYKQAVGPKNAALVISGDIDLDEATKLGNKVLGKWRGKARPAKAPAAPAMTKRDKVLVVAKPGLGQTVILMGRPALASGDADEWTLTVANAVFGGMFTSRLNMNLREDKGYTYGAFGMLLPSRGVGPLIAAASVQADKTGASLKEFMAEIQGFKTRPMTDVEFAMARDSELRSLPGAFETVSSLGGTLASLVQRDLPLDRLQKLVAAYQGMDKAAAQQAGEKYLVAENMQIVLVGDPELIKAQVEPLGLGPIELIEVGAAAK